MSAEEKVAALEAELAALKAEVAALRAALENLAKNTSEQITMLWRKQ